MSSSKTPSPLTTPSSEAVTNNVRVEVESRYVPQQTGQSQLLRDDEQFLVKIDYRFGM